MNEIAGVILLSLFLGFLILIAIEIFKCSNTPTCGGLVISAMLGLLPLYLVLCVLGILGEPDEDEDEDEEEDDESEEDDNCNERS